MFSVASEQSAEFVFRVDQPFLLSVEALKLREGQIHFFKWNHVFFFDDTIADFKTNSATCNTISFILRPGANRARWRDPCGRFVGAWFSRSSSEKNWRETWRPNSRGSSGATFSGVSLIGEQVSSSFQIRDWSNSSRVRPDGFSSGTFLGVSGRA